MREKKPWRHLPVHATLSLTWKSPGKARTMDGFTLRSSPGKCLRRRKNHILNFPPGARSSGQRLGLLEIPGNGLACLDVFNGSSVISQTSFWTRNDA